ncbi:MAG: hypothetical protein FK732_10770 [Asgard group archaeon]|nr:hypothetical protein [Asgard group archaeon]
MSISRHRVTNALFNQRFLLGVYVPLILEFLVFTIYTALRGTELEITWLIYLIIWILILSAPALFFYMVSPMFIYFLCGIKKEYGSSLRKNIDSLFVFSDDVAGVSTALKVKIEKSIEERLIPQLVQEVRGLYIDSYVSRTKGSRKENLLSSFESLLLFSVIWAILAMANFVGVIILHFRPISFDFITIDQIDNPINVAIFASVFAVFVILSNIIALYSIGRLRKLILETLPIVVYIDEEERIKQSNYIRALSQFPIESLVGDRLLRKHSRRIDPIYQQEFSEPLGEALRIYSRNQVAKQQAWRIYKPILGELKVTAEQTAVIKDKFFDSPFYEIARDVFSYEHEVNSLKTDIEYVKNRLKLWDKISEEEHATALVFLFRSTEQLFKSLIDRFDAPTEIYTSFSMILQFLKDKEVISEKEEKAFDTIRKKRNTLVHQSGRVVSIKKKEIELFLESLERTLLKVEDHFKGEEKNQE